MTGLLIEPRFTVGDSGISCGLASVVLFNSQRHLEGGPRKVVEIRTLCVSGICV